MQTYNVFEAKTHLSQLIQQVLNGEDVFIAKAGVPLIELKPIKNKSKKSKISPANLAEEYNSAARENAKILKDYSKLDVEGWDDEY